MTNYIIDGIFSSLTGGPGDYIKILNTALRLPLDNNPPVSLSTGGATLHNYASIGSGAEPAVVLVQGDGHRVVNFAGADLFGQRGIDYRGNDGQIVNLGTIRGADLAGVSMATSTDSVLDNRGVIEGQQFGVIVFSNSDNILIRNSGTIESVGVGVAFESLLSGARLENSGTISGGYRGVNVTSSANAVEITNRGTITGEVGIENNGTGRILNFGTIASEGPQPAILMLGVEPAGPVVSLGTINGDVLINLDGGTFRNADTGTLDGSFGSLTSSTGRQTVFNDGTITGDVFLFGGHDRYIATGDGQARAVYGGAGNDVLKAADAATFMDGGEGRDKISTGAGGGTLKGGADRDLLFGGTGADVFLFEAATDSANSTPDIIIGFERGVDVIDLDAVAAMPLAFDGTDALRGGGQASVNYVQRADGHLNVWVDIDGDGSRDMRIVVKDLAALDHADLGLDPLII